MGAEQCGGLIPEQFYWLVIGVLAMLLFFAWAKNRQQARQIHDQRERLNAMRKATMDGKKDKKSKKGGWFGRSRGGCDRGQSSGGRSSRNHDRPWWNI